MLEMFFKVNILGDILNKNRFGFVILNYNGKEDTINCVESLEHACNGKNYRIILVDNGSLDGSYECFQEKYSRNDKVVLLKNVENFGFSKGMNVGFRYAKYELNCNYICLLNNDIKLLTSNFIDICLEDYYRYSFAVLGPKIHTKDPNSPNTNPQYQEMRNPQMEYSHLNMVNYKRKIKCLCIELGLFWVFKLVGRAKRKICSIFSDNKRLILHDDILNNYEVKENVALHGSFLTFSPKYIHKFDGLEEVTFAYGEEWLLYNRCLRYNLKMMYEPRIEIFHLEHATLKRNSSEKEYFLKREELQRESRKRIMEYIKALVQ